MLEPRGLYGTDGKHPYDVTMIPWEMGKQLVWDVTVVDALAPSHLNRVRDNSSPAIWATIWRRSHGRQKCRPNGLIKLINYLIYLKEIAYLLYGSVASLPSPPSPSINIEA